MKLKMASAPSLSAPHSPIQGTSKPVKPKIPTELPKVNEPLRRSPRKPIPKLIVPKKFLEDVAFRSPSPKKQRKTRTESETSTVSPCSREVRDLVRNSFRPNINCRTRYVQVVFLNSYQLSLSCLCQMAPLMIFLRWRLPPNLPPRTNRRQGDPPQLRPAATPVPASRRSCEGS